MRGNEDDGQSVEQQKLETGFFPLIKVDRERQREEKNEKNSRCP
jgi:hypothetical protein